MSEDMLTNLGDAVEKNLRASDDQRDDGPPPLLRSLSREPPSIGVEFGPFHASDFAAPLSRCKSNNLKIRAERIAEFVECCRYDPDFICRQTSLALGFFARAVN